VKFVTMFRLLPAWRKLVYVVATLGAFALLIWDIADDAAQYTTVAFFVLIVIATLALRAPNRAG
jgi:hypothetical protein